MKMLKKSLAVISAAAIAAAVCPAVFGEENADIGAFSADTSDGTAVATYDELNKAITSGDKKIYVTRSIDAEDGISLLGGQELIGVPDLKTGKLPVINFENMKGATDITNSSSNDNDIGIKIRTADNRVANLVIEKAHDNGIQLKGTGATGNIIENCIVRYNNDSGIQIASGAKGNTLKGVYSYRNCDVYTLGSNADGFAIKLGAGPETTTDEKVIEDGKITIINCCAWDNGDDGWDSFDKESDYWTYRIDYTNCMAWNNGTPENCLGYTDYINGKELDENLPMMMRFKKLHRKQYNKFVKLYNKGGICSRNATAETYYERLDSLLGKIPTSEGELSALGIVENWKGNPNGFKLGSKYTQSISERKMNGCIAFDHNNKGFDNNNSFAEIWAEDCISFDNGKNYKLSHEGKTYTAYAWKNVFGWNGSEADELPVMADGSAAAPVESIEKAEGEIRAEAKTIAQNAASNITAVTTIFERVFPKN